MSVFHHPAFPEITETVSDDRDDEMETAGWIKDAPAHSGVFAELLDHVFPNDK